VDILLGKKDDRIQANRHDQLSTFGIGQEVSSVAWRAVFRQLIALGYLNADLQGHGTLQLTEKARPLLRGEESLQLRKQRKTEKTSKTARHRIEALLSDEDEQLFQALRTCRLRLAKERGVPPYVIFHDRTLQEMAATRPESMTELSRVSGVGERKLADFGADFLAVIRTPVILA